MPRLKKSANLGRPIRQAPDPVAAARKVVEEIAAGMKG